MTSDERAYLDEQFGAIKQKFDAMDQRFDANDLRFDRIESVVRGLGVAMEDKYQT